jgi:hypothetical protein
MVNFKKVVVLVLILVFIVPLKAMDPQAAEAKKRANQRKVLEIFMEVKRDAEAKALRDPQTAKIYRSEELYRAIAYQQAGAIPDATAHIAMLLEQGADPNHLCEGRSSLGLAIRCGYTETARLLLNAGARFDLPDEANERSTPLGEALAKNDADMLRLLIMYGAPLTDGPENDHLKTTMLPPRVMLHITDPLERAVLLGNEKLVRSLLDSSQIRSSETNALAYAVGRGLLRIVAHLLKHEPGNNMQQALEINYAFLTRPASSLTSNILDQKIISELLIQRHGELQPTTDQRTAGRHASPVATLDASMSGGAMPIPTAQPTSALLGHFDRQFKTADAITALQEQLRARASQTSVNQPQDEWGSFIRLFSLCAGGAAAIGLAIRGIKSYWFSHDDKAKEEHKIKKEAYVP